VAVRERTIPVSISQRDVTKLCRRVNNQVFGQAAQVVHGKRAPEEELGDEVPVRNPQQGVWNHSGEAELLGQELTIDLEGVASKGAASYKKKTKRLSEGAEGIRNMRMQTKWQLVDTLDDLLQALSVALPHPRVHQKKVTPADRLCSLLTSTKA